jgi:hypothetical protein
MIYELRVEIEEKKTRLKGIQSPENLKNGRDIYIKSKTENKIFIFQFLKNMFKTGADIIFRFSLLHFLKFQIKYHLNTGAPV